LMRAAGDVTGLVLAGLSAAIALMIGSWWIFLVGFLGYVVFTGYKLSCPECWCPLGAGTGTLRLPEYQDVTDPDLQSLVLAFHRGRSEVEHVFTQIPEEVKTYRPMVLSRLDSLEGCATRLLLRVQKLTKLISLINRSNIEDELRQLGELAQSTVDAETQHEYESALSSKQAQQGVIDEVSQARSRANASLLRVVVTVKGLPAQLIRLYLLDTQMKDSLSTDLKEICETLQGELMASEQTLEGLEEFGPAQLAP